MAKLSSHSVEFGEQLAKLKSYLSQRVKEDTLAHFFFFYYLTVIFKNVEFLVLLKEMTLTLTVRLSIPHILLNVFDSTAVSIFTK